MTTSEITSTKVVFGTKFYNINGDFGVVNGPLSTVNDFQTLIDQMNITEVNFALTMAYDHYNGVEATYQISDIDQKFDSLYDAINGLSETQTQYLINNLLEHSSRNRFIISEYKGKVISNLQSTHNGASETPSVPYAIAA